MDHRTNSWIAWLQIISFEHKTVNGRPSVETKAKRDVQCDDLELVFDQEETSEWLVYIDSSGNIESFLIYFIMYFVCRRMFVAVFVRKL
jgi:hypothetical protein